MSAFSPLSSSRLRLRSFVDEDAPALFNYRSDAITNKYQGWIPKSIKEVREFLNKHTTSINQTDTWYQLAIEELESGRLIGDVGIHFVDEHQAELGCTLDKHFQGHGYATEALRRIMAYLFEDLNKHRIIGSIDPKNVKSLQLMERLGFRKEGHFVESLLIDGQWVDDIIYAVLKREWNDIVILE